MGTWQTHQKWRTLCRVHACSRARKAAGWGMSLKRGQRGHACGADEDVALGFWLSRGEKLGLFNVRGFGLATGR